MIIIIPTDTALTGSMKNDTSVVQQYEMIVQKQCGVIFISVINRIKKKHSVSTVVQLGHIPASEPNVTAIALPPLNFENTGRI